MSRLPRLLTAPDRLDLGWSRLLALDRSPRLPAFIAALLVIRLALGVLEGTQDMDWWKAWGTEARRVPLTELYGAEDRELLARWGDGAGFWEVVAATQRRIAPPPYAARRPDFPVMQPPLYLYTVHAATSAYGLVAPDVPDSRWFDFFLNLPPTLFVAAMALLAARFVARTSGRDPWLVAVALLAHPTLLLNTPIQGYQDAGCAFFCLSAVLAVYDRRWESSYAALALAVLCKPQGVLVAPVVLWATFLEAPWRRHARAVACAAVASLVVFAPFLATGRGLSVFHGVISNTRQSVDLTRQALNLWWPVQFTARAAEQVQLGRGRLAPFMADARAFEDLRIADFFQATGVHAGWLGFTLLAIFTAFNLWVVRARLATRRSDLLVCAALQVLGYFMLRAGAQINHYLPMLPILFVAAWLDRAVWTRFVLLSAGLFLQDLIFYGLGRDWNPLRQVLCDLRLTWTTVVLALVNLWLFVSLAAVPLRPPADQPTSTPRSSS